jgi:polyhydroxybutyrate depolymerase
MHIVPVPRQRSAMIAIGVGTLLAAHAAAQAPLVRDTIAAGGRVREYYFSAADTAPPSPAPLVLFFHGGGGNARGAAARYGFSAAARGAIVVYPEGIDHHWSDGRDFFRNADDVEFTRVLLARLTKRWRIDTSRVFAVGHSNGGIMIYTLACRLPGAFAAIGTLGSALPVNDIPRCAGAKPLWVIAIHGTEDPLVPYDGGGLHGAMIGAEKNAAFWARVDGCDSMPTRTEMPRRTDSSETHATRVDFGACTRGRAVVLYELVGGGHGWPGENTPLPESLVGPASDAVNASQLIWEFLSALPGRSPN